MNEILKDEQLFNRYGFKKTWETDAEMYSTDNVMLYQSEKLLREMLRWRIYLFYIKY